MKQPVPEIWEQTDGTITHLVCTAGTGGTITGAAKFLKKKIQTYKSGQLMCTDVY